MIFYWNWFAVVFFTKPCRIFRAEPILEGRQKQLSELPTLKVYPFPLKVLLTELILIYPHFLLSENTISK